MEAKIINQAIEQQSEKLINFLKPFFVREEARQSALKYIQGLMSKVERKNSWQLAEEVGLKTPYAFQHLLGRALWNANEVRDQLQIEVLNTKEGGILAIDETGFLKKGKQSVGVARQYSGTAGKIENCQIGVFVSYAIEEDLILIDRELYIPEEWFKDKKRCKEAGIPQEISFKTKPQLACMMLKRALNHGIRPSWVVGDEVYGVYQVRTYLEENECPYVLAVASNYHISLGLRQHKVSNLLTQIHSRDWKCLSAGRGTKGERYYDWYRVKINSTSAEGWIRWLLFRKSLTNPQEVAYYIAFCTNTISLQEMVLAAGSRWTVEECFGISKGEVGLDHYEVRSYTGWYRHMTLCLMALVFLSKLKVCFNESEEKKKASKHSMENFLRKRNLI